LERAMFPSSIYVRYPSSARLRLRGNLTIDLDLEPLEGGPGKLFLWSSVLKSIGDFHICKILQDCTLHGQLVEVCVKEGDDSLREW
jgi:hypothetical protein